MRAMAVSMPRAMPAPIFTARGATLIASGASVTPSNFAICSAT